MRTGAQRRTRRECAVLPLAAVIMLATPLSDISCSRFHLMRRRLSPRYFFRFGRRYRRGEAIRQATALNQISRQLHRGDARAGADILAHCFDGGLDEYYAAALPIRRLASA